MSFVEDVVLNEYTLVRVLRDSQRSRVFVYRNPEVNKDLIYRSVSGGPEVFQLLQNISYPGLPEIYAVVRREDGAMILEQFIDGITIGEELERAVFSEKRTRKIIARLCDTLTVIHSLGVIHRDIKPSNIMLTKNDYPVLLDFDAARLYKPGQTGDTMILGTNGFAAPEQLDIAQTDQRSDIFAVGVLMNYMLTGEHPSCRHYKGRASRIIAKCTHVDPNKRYQTAESLKNWL